MMMPAGFPMMQPRGAVYPRQAPQFAQQPPRQPAVFPGGPQQMPMQRQQPPRQLSPQNLAGPVNVPLQPPRQPAAFPSASADTAPPWQQPRPAPPQWQQPRPAPPQNLADTANIPGPPPSMPQAQPVSRTAADDIPPPPARIRFQSEDQPLPEATPRPLSLPAPEQLGIVTLTAPPISSVDWNDVHARLQRLGAVSFQIQRTSANAHRVTFVLASGSNRPQQIEAEAANQADAVIAALQRAELVAAR